LRWALAKQWAKYFKRAAWGALAVFFAVNVYRSTLPLPYLQYMIDKIPDAVAYFEENRAEFQVEADNGSFEIYYNDPDSPSGPMVNMVYVYVVIPELYPDKTGQISRTKYIHPLDGQWYLMLFQGFAM
jgi:hypothetical protein